MAMGVFSSVFITAFALALTACATEKNLYLNFVDKKCVAETAKKQISVDWKQAKVLNFTIRDGVFDPDETYLKVNQPTILRFDNNDNTSRYFIDGEFFTPLLWRKCLSVMPLMIGPALLEWSSALVIKRNSA